MDMAKAAEMELPVLPLDVRNHDAVLDLPPPDHGTGVIPIVDDVIEIKIHIVANDRGLDLGQEIESGRGVGLLMVAVEEEGEIIGGGGGGMAVVPVSESAREVIVMETLEMVEEDTRGMGAGKGDIWKVMVVDGTMEGVIVPAGPGVKVPVRDGGGVPV